MLHRRLFYLSIALTLVCAGGVTLALSGKQGTGNTTTRTTVSCSSNPYQNTLELARQAINERYVGKPVEWNFATCVTNQEQLETTLTKTFATAGDAHLKFITPAQAVSDQLWRNSQQVETGLRYRQSKVASRGVVVKHVAEDSTAEEAGLKPGDLIVQVGDRTLAGLSYWDAHWIYGPAHSETVLKIERGGESQTISVKLDVDHGIGIVTELDGGQKVLEVTKVLDSQSSVEAGDVIVRINGELPDDAERQLNEGLPGIAVQLSLLRHGVPFSVTIERAWRIAFDQSFEMETLHEEDLSIAILRVKNLDWPGLVIPLDERVRFLERHDGIILDLSEGAGNDPEVAANLIARFSDGDFFTLKNLAGKTITYGSQNGLVYRKETVQNRTVQATIGFFEHSITKKLVIKIGPNTSAAAQLVAHALQSSGRAYVVGRSKSPRTQIAPSQFVPLDNGGGGMSVPYSIALDPIGQQIFEVSPDDQVWHQKDSNTAAKSAITGNYWYSDLLVVLPTLILLALTVLYCAGKLLKCIVDLVRGRLALRDLAIGFTRVSICVALLALGVVIAAWCIGGPPIGARSQIEVILHRDDSPESEFQAEVFQELKEQYSGAITFRTTHSLNQPIPGSRAHWAPAFTVRKIWLKSNGQIFRERNVLDMQKEVPKWQIVAAIKFASETRETFWPDAVVSRNKPARK